MISRFTFPTALVRAFRSAVILLLALLIFASAAFATADAAPSEQPLTDATEEPSATPTEAPAVAPAATDAVIEPTTPHARQGRLPNVMEQVRKAEAARQAEASSGPTAAPGAPNIVLVYTDDMALTDMESLPIVQRLLGEGGTTFDNSFVTTPLCCPSRASLLRGQYVHNHEVFGHLGDYNGWNKFNGEGNEDSTLATWLDGAGYDTVMVGKYLNGYNAPQVPPGWDVWRGLVGPSTWRQLSIDGDLATFEKNPIWWDDMMYDLAGEYVTSRTQDAPPFFMWLSLNSPHAPTVPADRHVGAFDGESMPIRPNFNEPGVADKPEWIQKRRRHGPARVAHFEERWRQRQEMMLGVEDRLEQLMALLESRGELENTYVIFTSDNGYHLGEHRLGKGKMNPYEEDIRVPMLVAGPDVPAGARLEHFVLNIDLAPTIADLAGVTPPDFVDGRSFAPLLTAQGQAEIAASAWRRRFMVENYKNIIPGPNGTYRWYPAPGNYGMRNQRYLFNRYTNGDFELYDLHRDPYQLWNAIDSAPFRLRRNVSQQWRALRRCAGATCHAAEGGMVPSAP